MNYFTKVGLIFFITEWLQYKCQKKFVKRRHLKFHRRLSIATFKFNHANSANEAHKKRENKIGWCVELLK